MPPCSVGAQGDRYPADSRDRAERTRARALARPARRSRRAGARELGGSSSPAIPTSRSTPSPTTAAASTPGACFACIPGARDRRPRPRGRGRRAGARSRCSSSGRSPLAVSQARVPSVRAALGPLAATLLRPPVGGDAGASVSPAPTARPPPPTCSRRSRRAAGERVGCDRHRRGARSRAQTVATEHTTPEASDLQELLARMRDAGVATVAMEVSSHALEQHRVDGTAVRRGVLHQPQSRAPRLPRLPRRVLRGEGATVRRRVRARAAAVNLDDPRGAELAARVRATDLDLWTFAVDDDSADVTAEAPSFAPDGTAFILVDRRRGRARRAAPPPRRSVQRGQRARGRGHGAGGRLLPRRTIADGLAQPAGRAGPLRADRRRPALHRARRLRPHARCARPRAGRRPPPGRRRRPGGRACSGAAATATRPSAR